MQVFYLHGFASSAASTKAGFFAAKLRAHGIALHAPDLNEPDFATLTITRMVDQVTSAIDLIPPSESVVLIGSSLGAFVAVQVALKRPGRIAKMVLLAPALDFGGGRSHHLGDRDVEQWKATGRTNVFHHGYGRMMPVDYELYADACGYDCTDAALGMPVQIFQGRNDTVVDPASVERWASVRPDVELHLVDDDHQLGGSLEYIRREAEKFLGLTGS
jgi:hypothetical protein